jgi:hypothetical protein
VTVALIAFAVAMVMGLLAENPADTILLRGLVAMLGGWILGGAVGLVAEHVVRIEMRKIDAAEGAEPAEFGDGEAGFEDADDGDRAVEVENAAAGGGQRGDTAGMGKAPAQAA